jgi:Holliday junction DNA helicase RuvA
MIGSLRGRLVDRTTAGELLVEVAGIGYRVHAAPAPALALGEVGGEVFVHVHHHIREDAQTLYGFATREERACFEALLGAHGVGPSLALAILSVHRPTDLARIVADGDLEALCLVPGVGKKTGQRLLVELKGVLDVDELEPGAIAAEPSGMRDAEGGASTRSDVREALVGLGYGPDEVRRALRDLPVEGDASSLLKTALHRLAVPG